MQSEIIDVRGPTMINDFAITDQHVPFIELPAAFDLDLAMKGTMPYRLDEDYGARVGIMARSTADHETTGAEVTWFEVVPRYVFHPMNALVHKHRRVTVDTARYEKLWAKSSADFRTRSTLHR